jgi:hypothetical protein
MCCVLFSWLTDQKYFKDLTDVDIRERLYKDNARIIEEELLPFGLISDGQEDYNNEPVTLETDDIDGWLSGDRL